MIKTITLFLLFLACQSLEFNRIHHHPKLQQYVFNRFQLYNCYYANEEVQKEYTLKCKRDDGNIVTLVLPHYFLDPYFLFRPMSIAI